MRFLLFLALALLVSTPLCADQPQIDLDVAKRVLKQGEKERSAWVADLLSDMRKMNTRKGKGVRNESGVVVRKLKGMCGSFFPSLTLNKGSIGVIRKPRIIPNELGYATNNLELDRSKPMKIFQIVDKKNALVKWAENSMGDMTLVWLKGFSTDGLTDDKTVTIKQPVQVTGTKQYNTTMGGSKTVMVIEPFHLDEKTLVKAAKELGLKPKK